MGIYSQLFLLLVAVNLGLKLYLNHIQKRTIQANLNEVPEAFSRKVKLHDHQKAGAYNMAKLKVDQIEVLVSSIIAILFTLGGGIQFLNNILMSMESTYPLTQGAMVIGLFSLINAIIALPFAVYSTFKVEQKFGFNKTTVKLFISDQLKGILLAIIIGAPLIYLILWLMNIMGGLWWLWVFGVLIGFNLLILVVYPTIIAPLFNKFKPLEDVVLRNRITRLLARCGFKSSGVFVMDGSKRSSHGNAYFTGIGKAKRIVFFDTLLKRLNHDEIEAVLAHELGHFKHRHVLKQMLVSFAITLLVLYLLSLLINNPIFYLSLGVTSMSKANGLILFMLLVGLVQLPFAPLSSYFSRKNEFEADRFAASQADKKYLIYGLTKLYRDNASTLTPNPLYVKFYYSHPPASVRIQALEQLA